MPHRPSAAADIIDVSVCETGSGLAVEVNSITPGSCSVNMAQPEADALRDCWELR